MNEVLGSIPGTIKIDKLLAEFNEMLLLRVLMSRSGAIKNCYLSSIDFPNMKIQH